MGGRKGEDCHTLTQPVCLKLISLWTLTRVTSWIVNTLVLTHVAGQTALIDICAENVHTQKQTMSTTSQCVCMWMVTFMHVVCMCVHLGRRPCLEPARSLGHTGRGRSQSGCSSGDDRGFLHHIHSHLKQKKGFYKEYSIWTQSYLHLLVVTSVQVPGFPLFVNSAFFPPDLVLVC